MASGPSLDEPFCTHVCINHCIKSLTTGAKQMQPQVPLLVQPRMHPLWRSLSASLGGHQMYPQLHPLIALSSGSLTAA